MPVLALVSKCLVLSRHCSSCVSMMQHLGGCKMIFSLVLVRESTYQYPHCPVLSMKSGVLPQLCFPPWPSSPSTCALKFHLFPGIQKHISLDLFLRSEMQNRRQNFQKCSHTPLETSHLRSESLGAVFHHCVSIIEYRCTGLDSPGQSPSVTS